MYDFFKQAKVSTLQEYRQKDPEKNKLYYTTVGPADLFCLPGSWLFFEKVSPAHDTIGLKIQGFGTKHLRCMEEASQRLTMCRKPNKELTMAVDQLVNHAGK